MPEAIPTAAPAAQPSGTSVVQGLPKATNGTAPPTSGQADGTPAPEHAFEVKVNGEMRKFTKAEAERLLSKSGYADQVIQQAKEVLKKEAERRKKDEEAERLWDDDERLEAELERRGKLDKLARKRLEAKLQESQMTPEQKAIAERDAEIARLKKESEARATEEKGKRDAATQKALQAQLETQLADAAKRAGMTVDAESFYAIYETVKEWQRLRLPWDADRVIATAQENIDGGFKRLEQSVTKGLKGKALVDRLGDAVVKEVLRYKVEEMRNGGPRTSMPNAPQSKPQATPDYLSPSDLANRYRGGR